MAFIKDHLLAGLENFMILRTLGSLLDIMH